MKFLYPALFVPMLLFAIGCTAETSTPATSSAPSSDSAPDSVAGVAVDSGSDATDEAPADPQAPSGSSDEMVADTSAATELPEAKLTIGSKAPTLDIEHWLSDGNGAFSSVTEFQPGNIYIVEFWATWCGPCVRSMPHLVELQEKHKDQVQVISVSDEDLETVKGFLERPYTEGGEDGPQTFGELTSAYCLTTDPDRSTGEDYMAAAGQNGIPACFLVGKTGLIEWIGHPMNLDEPLAKVIDGSWDRNAFGDAFKKSQLFNIVMMQIFEAAQTGDMAKAESLLADAKAVASNPQEMMQLQGIEAQLKMAPIAEKMQNGDIDGAIADLQTLVDETEGPIKSQVARILAQLQEQAADLAEEAEEEDVVEPSDSAE